MDILPDTTGKPRPLGKERGEGLNSRHFAFESLPGKIVKEGWGYRDEDQEHVEQEIAATEAYLTMLTEEYGITVAPHRFVVGSSLGGYGERQSLFCIEDYIESSQSLETFVQSGDAEALRAGTMLTGKLLDHINDVIKRGGDLDPEFFRYDQYVVQTANSDAPASLSGRLVLVDIEPLSPLDVLPPEQRSEIDNYSTIFWALGTCAIQVMELKEQNCGVETARYLLSMVDSLPDDGGLDRAKEGLKKCVKEGDVDTLNDFLLEGLPVWL